MKCFYITLILIILSNSVKSQVNNPQTEYMINHKVSELGRIVTFFRVVDGQKEIVIKDLFHNQEYTIPNISDHTVLNDDFMICWSHLSRKLYKIDFKHATVDSINQVSKYYWNEKYHQIIYSNAKEERIVLWNIENQTQKNFDNISFYSVSEQNHKVLLKNKKNEIILVDLKNKIDYFLATDSLFNPNLKQVLWSEKKDDIFLISNNRESIEIYKIKDKKLRKIGHHALVDLKKQIVIDTLYKDIRLLNNYIALGVKTTNTATADKNSPQVWLGKSKGITPQLAQQISNQTQLALIDLENGNLIDYYQQEKWIKFGIDSNCQNIFSWQVNLLEDFTKQEPKTEISFYNKENKNNKSLGVFNYGAIYGFKGVPFLLFFDKNHWHILDLKTNTTKNITKKIKGIFYNEEKEYALSLGSSFYKFPVNYANKGIILQEKNDIYLYNYKSDKLKRLTDGKSNNRHYSIDWGKSTLIYPAWSLNPELKIVEYDDLILKWHSTDYKEEGISILNSKGNTYSLIQDFAHFSQIIRSSNFITYTKEKFNLPPELYLLNIKTGETKLIYQSNKYDKEACRIKVEYIKWINKDGKMRSAVVRFPLNYNKDKSYPAIFKIYEKMRQGQNIYQLPLTNSDFNYRDYIKEEYFIIEPEIYYEIGNTGGAASDCIVNTFDKVINDYSVDKTNIGLIGHSFGGYETNFIITQTNRFKAAVSSAGVFDLESFYLTMNWETFKPDMWRMESQQWRLGKGMYEDRELYRKNSPSTFVENIKTPLLLITGEKDFQVNWQQSVMMFLAMKRLNKEVNLILYPGEGHNVTKLHNQKDMKNKIKNWFDYQLKKDINKPNWLKEGLH